MVRPETKFCSRCERYVYGSDPNGDPYEYCPVCATLLTEAKSAR